MDADKRAEAKQIVDALDRINRLMTARPLPPRRIAVQPPSAGADNFARIFEAHRATSQDS